MKLATFQVNTVLGRINRLGLVLEPLATLPDDPLEAVLGDGVQFPDLLMVDLNAAYAWILAETGEKPQPQRWADFLLPSDMRIFLEMGEPAMSAALQVATYFSVLVSAEPGSLFGLNGEQLVYPLDAVTLKTPIPNPRMLRDFLSFETHTANGFNRRNEPIPEAWYRMPVYYKGNPYTLVGPDEPVTWPRYSRIMDYELELACIIGKEGRDIPASEAGKYIAGYAILNDFSARDMQKGEMQCRLGPAKGKDFATAVGPWLVTADEVPDPRNLKMTAKINGELWSEGNAGTSHWTFEEMIAHVSQSETLYPGDILGSGTVGFGCGLELNKWLQPGDIVELEIDGLGTLRNQVLGHPDRDPIVYKSSS